MNSNLYKNIPECLGCEIFNGAVSAAEVVCGKMRWKDDYYE
jgi:hypothetical protein